MKRKMRSVQLYSWPHFVAVDQNVQIFQALTSDRKSVKRRRRKRAKPPIGSSVFIEQDSSIEFVHRGFTIPIETNTLPDISTPKIRWPEEGGHAASFLADHTEP